MQNINEDAMASGHDSPARRRLSIKGAGLAALLAATALLAAPSVHAETFKLAPNTKVTVSVVQWNPTKGEYQKWDAIGGTFVVSQSGSLSLPIVGSVDVSVENGQGLAEIIAAALQAKVGLLVPPEVTVEIASYPPIYVVGAVAQPGEYEYRPGYTVLQALARSGGPFRSPLAGGADTLSFSGELSIVHADILRRLGEIARLEAEQVGADSIDFPAELTGDTEETLVSEIIRLERRVFAARGEELKRQLETLAEKQGLYDQEIGTLEARASASDTSIEMLQKELSGVTRLYDRGIVTLGRQSELQRDLASLKVDRLTTDTDIMKVRQGINDTRRQNAQILDEHQTAIAVDLRDARAALDRLRSRKDTLVRMIGASGAAAARAEEAAEPTLTYTIVRRIGDEIFELPADEMGSLLPGDVLKVGQVRRSRTAKPSALEPTTRSSANPPAATALDRS